MEYISITKAIIEHLGRFSLFFTKTEKEGYLTSLVKFRFGEVLLINNEGFVIQGDMETSRAMITMGIERKPHKSIQILFFRRKYLWKLPFVPMA